MYQIDSIGNEYWSGTVWRKTLQEALKVYKQALIEAKLNVGEFGPIRVSIKDTTTGKIIKSKTFKEVK